MSENRLGLSLSGGGFRASLFHLGVLRRLAELRVLRHVTHISTVSGGSIVAAHYYLHLKKAYESAATPGVLADEEYVKIVKDVERQFIRGIGRDLRNRLLMNPLSHVEEFTCGNGYGRRMAQLYTKHFYRGITRRLFQGIASDTELQSYLTQGVPLHRAVVCKPGEPLGGSRSSSYPDSAEPERTLIDFNTTEKDLANIPTMVMNSTCLNTGGPFLFTLNEVGGPECGYVRTDEVFMLLQFKYLLERLGDVPVDPVILEDDIKVTILYGPLLEEACPELPRTALKSRDLLPKYLNDHLHLYQAAKARKQRKRVDGHTWAPNDFHFRTENSIVQTLLDHSYWPSIRHLMEASFGALRRAKIAAWHLLDHRGWTTERRSGLTRADYEAEFLRALRDIDERLVSDFVRGDGTFDSRLHSLVLDFYYFRSAEVLEWRAYQTLHEITISDAVAASANFPPVFTPFKIFGLFKEDHMSALSLTDGGVHDNQGVEALLDVGCTHIIVSDAGGLVRHEETAADARIAMMDRVIDVLMGGVRRVLMRSVHDTCRVSDLLERAGDDEDLRELRRATHLRKAAIIHMTSNPSDVMVESLEPFAAREVAALRTDLDLFNDLEIAALRHQGYQLADRYIRVVADSLEINEVPPPVSPSPDLPKLPTQEQLRVLRAGAHRSARYSVAYPLQASALALIVTFIALLLTSGSFSTTEGHWSSWKSVRSLLDDNVTDWFAEKRQTPGEVLKSTNQWASVLRIRDEVIEVASKTSLFVVGFGGWALVILARVTFRGVRAMARGPLKIDVRKLIGRKRQIALFKRGWNVLSMTCLLFFVFTLNVKWLLGIAQLWSIPLALVFLVVHFGLTPLWRWSGRLRPPKTPGHTALAPQRARSVG